MGQVLQLCNNLPQVDHHDFPAAEPRKRGPHLVLHILNTDVEASSGAVLCPFKPGEDVAVESLERVAGWESLYRRYERCAKERAASASMPGQAAGGVRRFQWPESPSCIYPRRCYKAKLMSSDQKGGVSQSVCMLQVAADPQHRSMEHMTACVQESKELATHASGFNYHLSRTAGAESGRGGAAIQESLPEVKVAVPAGAYVLGGQSPELAVAGEHVLLFPYSASEVRKYVFDGSEEFLELPQAFFHHIAWASGGSDLVCDLQGTEQDNGGLLFVDPCMYHPEAPGIGDLLSSVVTGPRGQGTPEKFEILHPRCGQLCKVFDPSRRGPQARRHCGLGISCGVGGG